MIIIITNNSGCIALEICNINIQMAKDSKILYFRKLKVIKISCSKNTGKIAYSNIEYFILLVDSDLLAC